MNFATTDRLTFAAALIFPTLCVIGSQFVGSATTSAEAGELNEFLVPTSMPSITLSTDEPDPLTGVTIDSPFYFESIMPDQRPDEVVDLGPSDPRPPIQRSLPEVRVTSILPHPKNPLAIIDGKPRRIGDTLESGWTVLGINGDDFTVTLRHTSGKEVRERMKKN